MEPRTWLWPTGAAWPWVFLGAVIVVIVMATYGSLGMWGEITTNPALAMWNAARQRWDARPFDHYHYTLVIVRGRPMPLCYQSVEVRQEHIVGVVENTCPIPPVTISQYLDTLHDHLANQDCIDGPCNCRPNYWADISYDVKLGYPSQVVIVPGVQDVPLRSTDVGYWDVVPSEDVRPACPLPLASGYRTAAIREFTPLP